MSVFISYTTPDEALALTIKEHLEAAGVWCESENFSRIPEPQLTDRILAMLDRCTTVLVAVSDHTRHSWWVPFEIGAAVRGFRTVVLLAPREVELPRFLSEWPRIQSLDQLPLLVANLNTSLTPDIPAAKDDPQARAELRHDQRQFFNLTLQAKVAEESRAFGRVADLLKERHQRLKSSLDAAERRIL